MMARVSVFLLTLALSACATTSAPDPEAARTTNIIEVRPAEVIQENTFAVDDAHELAKAEYADGNFLPALDIYKAVLIRAPKEYAGRQKALLGYADTALALAAALPEYFGPAEQAYEAIAAQEELSPDMQNKLLAGQILLAVGKGESRDVEVSLNKALEDNLDDPRLWNALGRFHDANKNWLAALETYVKAMHMAKDGHHPVGPIVNNMGMSLLLQGRLGESLEKFEHACNTNPDIKIYDNNRRLALMLTGDVKQALIGLGNMRTAQIYNDAGYISALNGHMSAARFYYEKAIEMSPVYFKIAEQNLDALDVDAEDKNL